jgi:hypothetical protein
MASASASAQALEWQLCVKAKPSNTGQWKDRQCKVPGGSTEKNYETRSLAKNTNESTGAPETVEEIEGTGGEARLASEISTTKVTIVCKKVKFSGKIEVEGKSKAKINYEECSLEGLSGCTVPNIEAKVLDRLIENSTTKEVEDEFIEEGAGPFATVVIEVCVLRGSYKVTGTQKCELPKGQELGLVHEIKCTEGGSSLKLGSKPASYTGNVLCWLLNYLFDWRVS